MPSKHDVPTTQASTPTVQDAPSSNLAAQVPHWVASGRGVPSAAKTLTPLHQRLEHCVDVRQTSPVWRAPAAARQAAWTNGEVMWHLRGIGLIERTYLATLDRSIGFASRGLLVSTGRIAQNGPA
jgi:hypothetical protein